jgi:hypothetical protein
VVKTTIEGPPPILSLANELIQGIAEYLDVESQICLSLSCKTIQYIIGTECRTDHHLRKGRSRLFEVRDEARRATFLRTLARDLAGWKYCDECAMLHPPPKSPPEWRPIDPIKPCLEEGGFIDYHPQGSEGRYIIMREHIQQASAQSSGPTGGFIPMMAALYSIENLPAGIASYDVQFSARRVQGDLILKASHTFMGTDQFQVTDILDLPVRICPHLTTSTKTIPYNNHSRWNCQNRSFTRNRHNSPLLTFAITGSITTLKPPLKRERFLRIFRKFKDPAYTVRKFKDPTYTEQNQMSARRTENDFWWCRSCPTKFQVKEMKENDRVVNVWQNFGGAANDHRWSALVRRDGPGQKQNWEFDGRSRNFGDFECY